MSAARNMLADACGGALECHSDDRTDASCWDLDRYAEHIRDRQVTIVELLFRLCPEEAEHFGQPYGDSFDAVEAALHHLELRAAILNRLVEGGRVTESEIDDIEHLIVTERRETRGDP